MPKTLVRGTGRTAFRSHGMKGSRTVMPGPGTEVNSKQGPILSDVLRDLPRRNPQTNDCQSRMLVVWFGHASLRIDQKRARKWEVLVLRRNSKSRKS